MTVSTVSYNLAGTVKHQGLPVAGLIVTLYDAQPYLFADDLGILTDSPVAQVKTSTVGEFNFSVRSGHYRLEVESPSGTRFLRQSRIVTVGRNNETLNINLSTGVMLAGSVRTNGGADAMLTEGEVVALGVEPSNYFASSVLREDEGRQRYAFVAPKGKYHVALRCRRYAQSRTFIASQVTLLEVSGDGTYDLVLSDFVRLKGRVSDLSGRPAANALVTIVPARGGGDRSKDSLLPRELGISATCRADEQGNFQIDLQPGSYDISIDPDRSGLLFGMRECNLKIVEDEERKFQLAEAFRLRGQVIYESTALGDCLVRVQGLDRKVESLTKTDAHGEFCLSVPAGNYKLIVSAHPKDAPSVTIDGEEYSSLAPWSRMVVVGGDTHVAVKLQQGAALHGRIVDGHGIERPGVRVSVFTDTGISPAEERLDHALSSGVTDGEGRYCLFLTPGTYWIAVHTDLANAQQITLGDAPVQHDVTWRGWCQTRWEIAGADGRKIPRCRVIYSPYGGLDVSPEELSFEEQQQLSRGYGLTDQDGVLKIMIPAGVYVLRFEPPPDSSYGGKKIKQLSISGDLSRSIKLSIKGEHTEE